MSDNIGSHNLDANQVIQSVYDPTENRLRVDTEVVTTVSGEAEVSIDAADDSIKIGNGTGDFLAVNPDGSINVNVLTFQGIYRSTFNEISSVSSGSLTNIVTYTVPAGKFAYLQRIDYGGTNIATYEIWVDGIKINKRRTYFSGDLSGSLQFDSTISNGYLLTAGQILYLKVIHDRPIVGDFEGRLQLVESP